MQDNASDAVFALLTSKVRSLKICTLMTVSQPLSATAWP